MKIHPHPHQNRNYYTSSTKTQTAFTTIIMLSSLLIALPRRTIAFNLVCRHPPASSSSKLISSNNGGGHAVRAASSSLPSLSFSWKTAATSTASTPSTTATTASTFSTRLFHSSGDNGEKNNEDNGEENEYDDYGNLKYDGESNDKRDRRLARRAERRELQLTAPSSATSTTLTTATADTVEEEGDNNNSNNSETWQTNHRSRWARRKHRKKLEASELQQQQQQQQQQSEPDLKQQAENTSDTLDWDSFEFGTSPKMDVRFNNTNANTDDNNSNLTEIPEHILNTIPTTSPTYKSYLQSEATIDATTSRNTKKTISDLRSLPPATIQKSMEILLPYVQPRRIQRIDDVLSQRTRHTRFLFENPSNPSNVWACLRTLDSFGIQYVDIIVNSESYQGKAAMNQKKGMRTAMGSACWMTLRQWGSVEEAVEYLREEEGCLIYASNLDMNSKDVRDLDWDVDVNVGVNRNGVVEEDDDGGRNSGDNGDEDETSTAVGQSKKQRPICIVMGNEERGISDKMKELADETFYLPMCGFAESFNLSVATAITLAYMSAVSSRGGSGESDDIDDSVSEDNTTTSGPGSSADKKGEGPLRPGDLDPQELQCLRLKGMINSVAQKRTAKAVLKQEGIILPNSLYS